MAPRHFLLVSDRSARAGSGLKDKLLASSTAADTKFSPARQASKQSDDGDDIACKTGTSKTDEELNYKPSSKSRYILP